MDTSEEFLDSLKDLIREEVKAGSQPETPPDDHPSGRAILALLLAAVNVALLLTITEDAWKDSSFVRFVGKVIPFLFGALFVALLDDIRKQLLTISDRWAATWVMGFVLVALLLLNVFTIVAATVPVRIAEGSTLVVDGTRQITAGQTLHTIELTGFRHHKLIASHPVGTTHPRIVTDVIDVSPWARVRAMWLVALVFGKDSIDASNLFPVIVTIDSAFTDSMWVRVTARMPRSVRLRVQQKDGFVVDSVRGFNRHRLWADPLETVWLTMSLPPDTPAGAFYLPDRVEPIELLPDYRGCHSTEAIPLRVESKENSVSVTPPECTTPVNGGRN